MKIKLVSTYPPTKCGIAEHAKQLADSLKKAGIEPEIIEIEKPTSSNPFYFLKLAQKAAKGSSKEDVIHIQFQLTIFGKLFGILPGFYISIFLVWLKILSKAKIVMALHDSPSKELALGKGRKEKALFFYYKFIYIFLRLFVDKFIAHSKKGEEINIKEWKIDKEKITTLPLGLPTKIIKLDKNKCKSQLGLRNKKILLILGYIRASKNYRVILESLKELKEEVVLLIVGKPQLEKDKVAYESIIKDIDRLKLNKRVKLLGFVKEEEIPCLLNATDIGITLHTQGGGDFMSSTMAMQLAYQIPMLSTNIPSFENLKKNEKCIETFNENDSVDLTKKIKNLLYNSSKIKYLKAQSQKYWEKNNWNEIGNKTKNLYLSLFK
jgi:glycosyltransferase involved in cell wall biosynthesis